MVRLLADPLPACVTCISAQPKIETIMLTRLSRYKHRFALAACVMSLALIGSTLCAAATPTRAVRASDFLNSIGANSAIAARGERLEKTIECAKYVGIRWFRAGVEGDVPIATYLDLHRQAGVRFSWGFGSGGSDLAKLIDTGRQVAAGGA